MKKIISYVLVLAIGFALGVCFQKRPADQKLESTVQKDAGQAATDVKTDAKKIDDTVTGADKK
ncbi:MAG TPA: hypothetical protein VMJ12_11385 [Candidatus Acidoferrales bacterium]|nr:hypothetical protein [Candidatus Acidoferrales bacterium]